MQPLPLVYAYRDDLPVVEGTRWEPRKVFCTKQKNHTDNPGVRYVVKFRRGTPESAAACISEVVSQALLREMQIPTFAAALVEVSPDMARAYDKTENLGYNVDEGIHFGTVFDIDIDPGPPTAWEERIDPQELVEMWVAESWLMNIDRENYGNIVMVQGGSAFHLLAADQSDCFLGAGRLANGSCFQECRKHGPATYRGLFSFVDRAVADLGCTGLYHALQRVQDAVRRVEKAATKVEEATHLVPVGWWKQARVEPDDLAACLIGRANQMRQIVDVDRLEGIHRVVQQFLRGL